MKGLKEFLELLKEDKVLFSEVEKVQNDAAKVVEIAKKHGYEFTEEEYNDLKMEAVSGGNIGSTLKNLVQMGANYAGEYLSSDEGKEKINTTLNQVGNILTEFSNKDNKQ